MKRLGLKVHKEDHNKQYLYCLSEIGLFENLRTLIQLCQILNETFHFLLWKVRRFVASEWHIECPFAVVTA